MNDIDRLEDKIKDLEGKIKTNHDIILTMINNKDFKPKPKIIPYILREVYTDNFSAYWSKEDAINVRKQKLNPSDWGIYELLE